MKGKLKTKRFNALVESLNSAPANHLGPYGGGKYREVQLDFTPEMEVSY